MSSVTPLPTRATRNLLTARSEAAAQVHDTPISTLQDLVLAGSDRLPFPGSGRTLNRWRALALVAEQDLSLAKLFEGHTDALAILHELTGAGHDGRLWATWCAEPPEARLSFAQAGRALQLRLNGRKAWCSGAAVVSHAIVSGWNESGEQCLAAVALDQAGVRITDQGWHAVGMADCASVNVEFNDAVGEAVGGPQAYLQRSGFWHGGAGIAACWWGGAVAIARVARAACAHRCDAHQAAHLGSIDVALQSSGAVLREAAAWIDQNPGADAHAVALRTRLVVERDAELVMHHAARAVGAGPLCKNPRFARAMADLPVFMRQSHAEKDLAALGQLNAQGLDEWTL